MGGVARRAVGATILHADLDAFFASVEQRDDPRLRGRPVIVGGGVVLAASYEAKAFGVADRHGRRARPARLCPRRDRRSSPGSRPTPRPARPSSRCSSDTTPLVEGLSIDEAFLDVGGLRRVSGTPGEIAVRLRREVLRAGRAADHRRRGADEVPGQGGQRGRQAGRPAGRASPRTSWPSCTRCRWSGCGASGRSPPPSCTRAGITTVGEVAALPRGRAGRRSSVRPSGRHLHALAHNRDPRPVEVGRRRRSIGSQRALGRRRRPPDEVDAVLAALVDRVTRRMRAADRVGRTVVLRLRFDDFSRATRSHTLARATAHTETILTTVAGPAHRGAADDRAPGPHPGRGGRGQPRRRRPRSSSTLPFDRASGGALDAALDEVRERFGSAAVTRAVLLGRDDGMSMPHLPD